MKHKSFWIVITALAIMALLSISVATGCDTVEKSIASVAEEAAASVESALETPPAGSTAIETAAETKPVNLVIWWWGEQYQPGLEAYLKETAALFEEKYPNITVELTLQGTEVVLTQFPMSAAAGTGPDLQFTWDGVYTIPWVWLDYLEPLDNWIEPEELDNMLTVGLSQYGGKIWRSGFWDGAGVVGYNKDYFKQAGIDPEQPINTWDEFLAVCKKLKDAGIQPIGYGAKDLFAGEHMFALGTQASMDSFQDLVDLAEGTQSWADKRYYSHWEKWLQLFELGYINEDMLSITWSEGHDLFLSGDVAMAEPPFSIVKLAEDSFGEGSVGILGNGSWPGLADGKWDGKNSPEAMGGFVMSSLSPNKKEAAEFLKFLHSEERMNALWTDLRVWPSDKRFDYASKLTSPVEQEVYNKVLKPFKDDPGNFAFWASLLMPPAVMNDIGYGVFQQVFTGDMTPEQLGMAAQDSMIKWKGAEPDFVANYITWLKQMNDIYG